MNDITKVDWNGDTLHANQNHAIAEAQAVANENGAPCGVLERDGWFAICVEAPDTMDCNPLDEGWTLHAIVDPANGGMQPDDYVTETQLQLMRANRIIADLMYALDTIHREAEKEDASRHYIMGVCEGASGACDRQRVRNSDGYMEVR